MIISCLWQSISCKKKAHWLKQGELAFRCCLSAIPDLSPLESWSFFWLYDLKRLEMSKVNSYEGRQNSSGQARKHQTSGLPPSMKKGLAKSFLHGDIVLGLERNVLVIHKKQYLCRSSRAWMMNKLQSLVLGSNSSVFTKLERVEFSTPSHVNIRSSSSSSFCFSSCAPFPLPLPRKMLGMVKWLN